METPAIARPVLRASAPRNRTTAMAASASTPVSAKMPGTPIHPRQHRPHDQRHRERGGDGDADGGHRARAHDVAREVGGAREHRRRNGTRALQALARR